MTDTVADADWADLAPPINLPPAIEAPPDKRPEDAPLCPVCNEPIIRDPSWKRMRKYHPECAGSVSHHAVAGEDGTKRRSTGKAADKEADRCEEILRGFMVKAALAVSIVDRFDAFCIMVNAPAVCSSFRAVCIRYPDLRKEFLRVPEGGSVFSLVAAMAFMAAPIAAHHGLIPSKRVAEMLVNLPLSLYKLHERMKQGEEGLTSMMKDHMEAMNEHRTTAEQENRRAGNGQYVGPTRSPG